MDEREIEQASRLEDIDRLRGIARARENLVSAPCGHEIPPERLALGAKTCIECQRELELIRKLGLEHYDG